MDKCGLCQYKRRRCASTCLHREVYPSDMFSEMGELDRLYDFKKLEIYLRNFHITQRKQILRSMVEELQLRFAHPAGGCSAVLKEAQQEVRRLTAQVQYLQSFVATLEAALASKK